MKKILIVISSLLIASSAYAGLGRNDWNPTPPNGNSQLSYNGFLVTNLFRVNMITTWNNMRNRYVNISAETVADLKADLISIVSTDWHTERISNQDIYDLIDMALYSDGTIRSARSDRLIR